MKAIILVAGQGTRLRPYTSHLPKCLVEVHGKALLLHTLEALERTDIEEVLLIIGYFGHEIQRRIGSHFGRMNIHYAANTLFETTSTSYSLWLALQNLQGYGMLVVLEGDLFFEKGLLKTFLHESADIATLVEAYHPPLDGSFVLLDERDIVVNWLHESARPANFVLQDAYKTINIHKFSETFSNSLLFSVLRRHIEEKRGTEPLEFVMQDIVLHTDAKIQAFKNRHFAWVEIDTVEELRQAEAMILNHGDEGD